MAGTNQIEGAVVAGGVGDTSDADPAADGIATSIVYAVADANGVDPLDLDATLHESIDTDALTALLRTGEDVTVDFEAFGHRITVSGDGRIEVHDAV